MFYIMFTLRFEGEQTVNSEYYNDVTDGLIVDHETGIYQLLNTNIKIFKPNINIIFFGCNDLFYILMCVADAPENYDDVVIIRQNVQSINGELNYNDCTFVSMSIVCAVI